MSQDDHKGIHETAGQDIASLPKVGVSACLLGQLVRYDGGHKLQGDMVRYFEHKVLWVTVCPEVECGLPIPRDPMHLQGVVENPSLVVSSTGEDLTEKFRTWLQVSLPRLLDEKLSGMILKSKSPSCGMEDIPVFSDGSRTDWDSGRGLFAGAFMASFPDIPIVDEAALRSTEAMVEFYQQVLECYKNTQLARTS